MTQEQRLMEQQPKQDICIVDTWLLPKAPPWQTSGEEGPLNR